MARSTLELLLESIKDREEEPPDHLPALPQRPTSRARLPSRKRTSALLFTDPSSEPNGHIRNQALAASDAPIESNGKGHSEVQASATSAHLKEVLTHAFQNGHGKGTENGDPHALSNEAAEIAAISQDHSQESVPRIENKGFVHNSDLAELRVHLKKQGTAYTSLKKRRRVHHISYLPKDSRVWLPSQQKEWMLGVVQSADDLESVVRMADGQLLRVSPEKLLPANPELLDGVDDLVQLSYIHEPAVLYNLQCRYELGKLCTRAGPALIAFSPNKENSFRDFHHSSHNSLETSISMAKDLKQPHVYTIADDALDAMKRDWKDQSIIISGDSGAGKTQSAEAILQHLVSRGGHSELGKILLLTNPILEAFGNANISNSINASRFGKLMDMNFDKSGKLCSAYCQIVFFEKSRVVCRPEGEHSYHIFYQLCEGADAVLREKLNLRGASEYEYLKKSGYDGVNGAHHYSNFQSLLNALHFLGFTEKVQQDIFSLLAAILWLGNISSASVDNKNQAVDAAAKLLKCSRMDLLGALGFGGPNPDHVVAARDALACSIYESLFNWLVAQINKSLKLKKACDFKSISVLDVPGFGFSKSNGLEGLLVNYAHENLQQFVRWHLLQQQEEVVTWGGFSSRPNNSSGDEEGIEFLEHELFPLLVDEEADALSEGSESRFMRRLERLVAGSSSCKQLNKRDFAVYHTFGEATYNVPSLFKEVKDVLSTQSRQILRSCMSNLPEISAEKDEGFLGNRIFADSSLEESSFSSGQERVLKMIQQLDNTSPHFISCIAPNELQLKQSLQQEYVLRQLRISRMTEAVRLCRSGYPIGISHQLFATRFGVLLGPDVMNVRDSLGICVALLRRLEVPPHMYQVGLTKVFFHSEQVDKLEHARKEFFNKIVGIQKTFRGYRVRNQLERQKLAITHLQALVRGWLVRKGFSHQFAEKEETGRSSVYENKVVTKPVSEPKNKDADPWKDYSNDGDYLTKEDETSIPNQRKENVGKKNSNHLQVKNFLGDLDEKRMDLTALDEVRRQRMAAEEAVQRKEEENTVLQQSLKEYERKWIAYEAKMKSMEEMWQKQIASLEQSLSVATKGGNAGEPANKTGDSDYSVVQSTTPQGASIRDTPETTFEDPELTVGKGELDPSRSVLDHLSKELEHRTQVFNDDAKFLVEVKSGQIEANFKPDEELQKLRQRFDVWKKDYKGRLKETKGILKKLGKSDSAEKSKKKWWSKR